MGACRLINGKFAVVKDDVTMNTRGTSVLVTFILHIYTIHKLQRVLQIVFLNGYCSLCSDAQNRVQQIQVFFIKYARIMHLSA